MEKCSYRTVDMGWEKRFIDFSMQVLWLVVLLKCRVEKHLKKAKQTKIQVAYGISKWAYWAYHA